jgi:hypothetical protein
MFHVPLTGMSVSVSAVAIAHNLVLPRILTTTYGQSDSSLIGSLTDVQFIAFEFRSELYETGTQSFANYASLRSVCLSASVEFLGKSSFSGCCSLAVLTFESGSELPRIEPDALCGCSSLKSICLPAQLQMIDSSALVGTGISRITLDDGNRHLRVSGNFLLGSDGISAIRYFRSDSHVALNREIEILGPACFYDSSSLCSLVGETGSKLTRIEASALSGCSLLRSICLPASVEFLGENSFSRCYSLSSFTFESGSKLTRIEANTLSGCSSLESILIPRSMKELGSQWVRDSSLHVVMFESALSLRIMIQTDKVDLREGFVIQSLECETVETVQGANDMLRLVKRSSLA